MKKYIIISISILIIILLYNNINISIKNNKLSNTIDSLFTVKDSLEQIFDSIDYVIMNSTNKTTVNVGEEYKSYIRVAAISNIFKPTIYYKLTYSPNIYFLDDLFNNNNTNIYASKILEDIKNNIGYTQVILDEEYPTFIYKYKPNKKGCYILDGKSTFTSIDGAKKELIFIQTFIAK